MRRCGISENDMAAIATLRGLERLELQDTPVSDEGAKHLHGLPKLEFINLGDTKVTQNGICDLSASLPSTHHILYGPDRSWKFLGGSAYFTEHRSSGSQEVRSDSGTTSAK
jgi:hypothetical protein